MRRSSVRNPLRRFYHFGHGSFWVLLFLCLSACSTSPNARSVSLETVLASSTVTAIEYETTRGGLIVFALTLSETGPGKFLLDTGATTSAIYRNAVLAGTIINTEDDVRVHDMVLSARYPTVSIQNFHFGSNEIAGERFAVLDKPAYDDPLLRQTKGIIGLDILADYRLMIDPVRQTVFFISAESPALKFDKYWVSIPMSERPFKKDVLGLHFLELKINDTETYAVVDTGSEFNVMNWNFTRLRKFGVQHRRLRKAWKATGVIGEFEPRWVVILEGIKFKNHTWPDQRFSVSHLGLFDTMDLADKPLMLAGMPFFENRVVLIDFPADVMWVKITPDPN